MVEKKSNYTQKPTICTYIISVQSRCFYSAVTLLQCSAKFKISYDQVTKWKVQFKTSDPLEDHKQAALYTGFNLGVEHSVTVKI